MIIRVRKKILFIIEVYLSVQDKLVNRFVRVKWFMYDCLIPVFASTCTLEYLKKKEKSFNKNLELNKKDKTTIDYRKTKKIFGKHLVMFLENFSKSSKIQLLEWKRKILLNYYCFIFVTWKCLPKYRWISNKFFDWLNW